MSVATDRLKQLQHDLARLTQDEWWTAEVSYSEEGGLITVSYYGHYDDEAVGPVFAALCLPEVAGVLGSLSFAGEDEGANGTKFWDFTDLLDQEVEFPYLHTLSIELYDGQGNRPIIAHRNYEEDGQLARWLDHAPQLAELTTPSAPGARFFQRPAHPLRLLRVQAGYATQRFVPNLAQSACFPALQQLDWTEIEASDVDAETEYNISLYRRLGYPVDMEKLEKVNAELKEQGAPISFEQFEALVRSAACPPSVTLRDPILTADQITLLQTAFNARHPNGSLSLLSPHTDPYWSPLNKLRKESRARRP